MFKPRVPLPVPLLAVTVQTVAGAPPVGVTLVMAGVPPSAEATSRKLLPVRPEIALAKVTLHETELVLVGLAVARLIEATVVSGRSRRVMVGSLAPPTVGSSVRMVAALLLWTVAWLLSWVAPRVNGLSMTTS